MWGVGSAYVFPSHESTDAHYSPAMGFFNVLKIYSPYLHHERGGSRAKSKLLLCEQRIYGIARGFNRSYLS